MEKVYLKYDDIRPYVECDYGFQKEILFLGFLYPYKKGDLKHFFIIMILQLAVCTLFIILFKFAIMYKILLCIIMIFLINLLFACNYNMLVIERLLKEGYYPMDYNSSDKLIKKGIYFKLQSVPFKCLYLNRWCLLFQNYFYYKFCEHRFYFCWMLNLFF